MNKAIKVMALIFTATFLVTLCGYGKTNTANMSSTLSEKKAPLMGITI